ncbi:MAG: type 4a pilus biogenesis protein PilO, partial [Nitrososphaera sp.]|nr:type 4a pilus biogenesis protein PilO [Nitrososphaera sp.]
MKMRLSSKEQRILLIVVVLGILISWIYATYVTKPLLRESEKLNQELQSSRQQLRIYETAANSEATLREQYRQLERTVSSLQSILPAEEELPTVIERISDLANQADVKIQTIFPQRPIGENDLRRKKEDVSAPVFYKDVTIQVDALANY